MDALGPGSAGRIVREADVAWTAFHRAVTRPTAEDARALAVGTRTHGFGRDAEWSVPRDRGVMAALRGDGTWREGEIAESASPLRRPALHALQVAYTTRLAVRAVRDTARRRAPGGPT